MINRAKHPPNSHAMLTDSERKSLNAGYCCDCGHRGFVGGPRVGVNIHIECGNLACRKRFNVAYWDGSVMAGQRMISRAEGGPRWGNEPPE